VIGRREFIALLGGAATVWPVAAPAQQGEKLPMIGVLGADASTWRPWTDAFVARLRELGWIEGRTIAIEYRWAKGRPERNAEIATEFVRLKVNAIVTAGSVVSTLKQATADIPIVFAVADDPVGGGLVASLARPGGNVTGLSIQSNDLGVKRLELLHEVVPRLHHLAIMFDADYSSAVRGARDSNDGPHAWHRRRAGRNPASRGYCSSCRNAQDPSGCSLRRGR
jgi:putative ABC transport system substrate-binding protein